MLWWLPLTAVMVPVLGAFIIGFIQEDKQAPRSKVAIITVLISFVVVLFNFKNIAAGGAMEMVFFSLAGAEFVLRADAFSAVFALVCNSLWILSIIYATGYMEEHLNHRRFFTFYVLNLGVACGIAFSGNLFTLFIFYKLLTLTTFPLVAHSQTAEARKATMNYVYYSVASGAMILYTVIILQNFLNQGLLSELTFTPGGVLGTLSVDLGYTMLLAFVVGFLGFAVKAAMIPFHPWLPGAMVAVAPVSALFHAVAVVNTGVFGIVRLVYYIYGPDWVAASGLYLALVFFAVITMIVGSCRALVEDQLKLRLAYSTISQMGYLTLGAVLLMPAALTGTMLHFFNHAFLKITLFFCAGIIISMTGRTKISQLGGIGKRYPRTMFTFSIAALGLVGVPPICGYLIKLYLLRASIEIGGGFETVLIISLVIMSAILNAIYYLPIVFKAFWGDSDFGEEEKLPKEKPLLLYPAMFLAFCCILLGLFPAFITIPLAELVVNSVF
ncbi:complex I subunit 5 family protein [Candidatus Contubernalis alkaliaceticus]|uniref:complex I subunit 5 family protein n=1 Tax=Candidatus Contubernalis alkaliaceticus TaxID=338645 RepID=UPI001F4C3E4C|nr:proton-conducting transporter membrane subunit [Candidatus Contubernalis alkalaceticus]UNC91420.1 monovalent cation/H+ antiporter subunit D family protein [Candidatus Contubernalis alkalaceticus]